MEYKTYHNSEGAEVRAAVVTDEDAGSKVQTVGGRPHTVQKGEVVIQTQNANYVDVLPAKVFNNDYREGEYKASRAASTEDSDAQETDGLFDPDARSAAEVREYLSRTDISHAERSRVRSAEESGRNRKTAYPE